MHVKQERAQLYCKALLPKDGNRTTRRLGGWITKRLEQSLQASDNGPLDIQVDSVDLVAHELSIEGSFVGTQRDMRTMLMFAQAHDTKPMIELMPMSQVNRAIERLKQNKARYRIVLENDIE